MRIFVRLGGGSTKELREPRYAAKEPGRPIWGSAASECRVPLRLCQAKTQKSEFCTTWEPRDVCWIKPRQRQRAWEPLRVPACDERRSFPQGQHCQVRRASVACCLNQREQGLDILKRMGWGKTSRPGSNGGEHEIYRAGRGKGEELPSKSVRLAWNVTGGWWRDGGRCAGRSDSSVQGSRLLLSCRVGLRCRCWKLTEICPALWGTLEKVETEKKL